MSTGDPVSPRRKAISPSAKTNAARSATAQDNAYTFVQLLSQSKSNENVHVFCLPPFKKDDKSKKYKYENYFMCCYDFWKRQKR